MLLASQPSKYMGMDKGILNIQLMKNILHVVAYNLAKSRMAGDGETNSCKPPYLRVSSNVLVKDYTAKAFWPNIKTTAWSKSWGNIGSL